MQKQQRRIQQHQWQEQNSSGNDTKAKNVYIITTNNGHRTAMKMPTLLHEIITTHAYTF